MAHSIVKDQYYKVGDEIVQAHYSGNFYAVDCNSFVQLEELEDKGYSEEFIEKAKENSFEYNGDTYYPAEWGPYNVDDDWELLVDFSI